MIVRVSDDVVSVVPGDDGVWRHIQGAAQPHRVAFGDVTVSQLRRKLESRTERLRVHGGAALGQRAHHLPSGLGHRRDLGGRRGHPKRHAQRLERRQRPVMVDRRRGPSLHPVQIIVLSLDHPPDGVPRRHLRLFGGRRQMSYVFQIIILDLHLAVSRIVLPQDVDHLRAVRNDQFLADFHPVHFRFRSLADPTQLLLVQPAIEYQLHHFNFNILCGFYYLCIISE